MDQKNNVRVEIDAPASVVADAATRAAAFGWSENDFWLWAMENALYGQARTINLVGQSGSEGDEQ